MTARILRILRVFRTRPERTPSEISETAGLPLTTTYRLMTELHDGALLSRDADRRVRVGPLMTALATFDDTPAVIH